MHSSAASRTFLSEEGIDHVDDYCTGYVERIRFMTIIHVAEFLVLGIIVLRVWALRGSIALLGLLIQDYVGEIVELNTSLASLPGCYATSVPSIIAGQWLAPIIVETVLFGLVISRAFLWWKDAMLLANYLMFELGPVFLSSLLVTPSTTAGCILGSHMLLNLRVMSGHKLLDEYGTESTSVDIPVPRRQPRTINSVGILDGATNPFPYPSHTATVRDAIDKVFERHDPNHIK
ncbi:hypothetical protein JR316_0010736 [Psilocybe cubensis]|uniref:Uncharacterized protein n=1 Tax=Psilocybe cubensis TaxID=181762 RepID=A0ACB8GMN7_PSICU|nr:hypothetical protein JR316_0010736 [Psilocybe cubensis]KAH9476821.1 hypothetical protein JR316_0010736 [Psilocybe cubensis]